MPPIDAPWPTVRAPGSMVASADSLATQAGLAILATGGNAVDAAIAANAVLAVTSPHLCGLGGDLFALVHAGAEVHALDASGAAGSGTDATALRHEGHREMPFRHDIRTVTVPGCVDGWGLLHERFGRLPLTAVLAPAVDLAERGFPASPLLVGSLWGVDEAGRVALHEIADQATRPGARVRRPGVADALRAVAESGRESFYRGPFGEGLLRLGQGLFDRSDLERRHARWVEPLRVRVADHHLWTVPPPSQGYLALGSAILASDLPLPEQPDDPSWVHLLVEAAVAAGRDRPDRLHDGADGDELLAAVTSRRGEIDLDLASTSVPPDGAGDTTYLCAVDHDRMAVSLIQSNASGFGSWLVEPRTGINLHNRGLGFSLHPGHPAELAPGRRPPHTLSPLLVTRADGALHAVLGTMGGDAQPQILLQLLTRLLRHHHSPGQAVAAPRWTLRGPRTGFDTWTGERTLQLEGHAPSMWAVDLRHRGHQVEQIGAFDSAFGHAHCIVVEPNGMLAGSADPRSRVGGCAGR